MATPTFEEIRREATARYQADKLNELGTDFAGSPPEDRELREGGYFAQAQRELMKRRGVYSAPRPASGVTQTRSERSAEVVAELRARQEGGSARVGRFMGAAAPEPDPRAHVTPEGKLYPAGRSINGGLKPLGHGRLETEPRPRGERQLRVGTSAAYDEAQERIGAPPVSPFPVEHRDVIKKGPSFGRSHALRATAKKAAPSAFLSRGALFEAAPSQARPLYGRAGEFVIYTERGPFNRKFYRVRFQGRAFAPAFDTPEQAKHFIEDLKTRAEPEYAGRRERMVEADRRFFTETVIAHRQHPLFVRVVDRTSPPPSRLTS